MTALSRSARAETLARLLAVHGYPCVSILMSTPPGPSLAPADRARLDRLLDEAVRRLGRELPPGEVERYRVALRNLAERSASQPCRRSLGLFIGQGTVEATSLAVSTRDRVVVDATFATRDLVGHANRASAFWVLTVSERMARLFRGDDERLRLTGDDPLVTATQQDAPSDERPRRDVRAFLRAVATALDASRDDDAPLVVAGVERLVTELTRLLGPTPIAIVRGNHDRTSLARLHELAWPTVEEWLDHQQHDALTKVDQAHGARRLATGLEEVWSLAADGRVELLVVEDGFEVPVRVGDDPTTLDRTDDREAPDVVDDAVDELVETVLARRGRAVFVSDGSLEHRGRVAAVLRY